MITLNFYALVAGIALLSSNGAMLSNNGPLLSDNGPMPSENAPIIPGDVPLLTENALTPSESTPIISGEAPVLPEKTLTTSENAPLFAGEAPLLPENALALSENAPALSNDNGTLLFNNMGTTEQDFRIPAICADGKGGIVVFADRRFSERGGDIGAGEIDIQCRISRDGGVTWDGDSDNPRTVIDGNWGSRGSSSDGSNGSNGSREGSNGFDCAHGDAAVVWDRKSGEILLMCASGATGYNRGGCLMGRYYSYDGGRTFTGGEMTTDNGLPAELAATAKFFSSGRICQSRLVRKGRYYRIYAGLATPRGGQVVYSDDFGRSWQCLGEPVACADECKVEELPDGSVLLSSRIKGRTGRMFSVFTYEGRGWMEGSWSRSVVASGMVAAACNGEVLLVPAPRRECSSSKGGARGKGDRGGFEGGKGREWILLQSVARSESRENVSIYWKRIGTKDDYRNPDFYNEWDGCMQVCEGTSCYSTMVPDGRGNIAFVWEQNNIWRERVESYDIMFRCIPLEEIIR